VIERSRRTSKTFHNKVGQSPGEDFCVKLKFVLAPIFAAVLLAQLGLFFCANAQTPRRIEVSAKRFSFTPSELTLKKGEAVVIVLKSEDTTHGLRIKELGIDLKAAKGKTTEFDLTPDKTGDFAGRCSSFCGSGHSSMMLTIHVVE
jgi:cytochrome c oxidase subunit II